MLYTGFHPFNAFENVFWAQSIQGVCGGNINSPELIKWASNPPDTYSGIALACAYRPSFKEV